MHLVTIFHANCECQSDKVADGITAQQRGFFNVYFIPILVGKILNVQPLYEIFSVVITYFCVCISLS